ncbi:beta-ketoacyl-ACP synthase III [Hydrocarboniphaga sp.]|uniref:beta-ketoacyl-ACP synthase III n=1 Tax=Hydrocarboniphaga sp. TaxID=2033016 RepID=UPI003D13E715
MKSVCISGTGLFTPAESISNDELVACYNAYVAEYNEQHAADIAAGALNPLPPSSSEFIVKASGIQARYVVNKSGVLDTARMRPTIRTRGNDEPSLMAEMGVAAAKQALEAAKLQGSDIDCVLVACSNMQRAYPALAVEIQSLLGAGGYGYDINVACASAAFGVQAAVDALRNGSATRALVISPEICSGHLNFRNRDCHFIFGDAATAVVVEFTETAKGQRNFEILGTRLQTQFSSNIRNNAGFLNSAEVPPRPWDDVLFRQEGRKVFKEVVPMVSELIAAHLADLNIEASGVRRFWLHQANLSMNEYITRKLLGRDAERSEAPVILDEYANTSSAGSVIAFHKYQQDLVPGDIGVLCGFGAGYSAGSVIMRRI